MWLGARDCAAQARAEATVMMFRSVYACRRAFSARSRRAQAMITGRRRVVRMGSGVGFQLSFADEQNWKAKGKGTVGGKT